MAAGDLTTLANVKLWLAQDGAAANDDALLLRLITAASQFLQAWMSRTVAITAYAETRNGNDQYQMPLKNWPITTVTAVNIDGLTIPLCPALAPSVAPSVGYVYDNEVVYLRGYLFSRGVQNVLINYSAGWAVTPPAIEQACIELVVWRYRERGREGQSSKNIGNGQVVSFKIVALAPQTLEYLLQYRSPGPVW